MKKIINTGTFIKNSNELLMDVPVFVIFLTLRSRRRKHPAHRCSPLLFRCHGSAHQHSSQCPGSCHRPHRAEEHDEGRSHPRFNQHSHRLCPAHLPGQQRTNLRLTSNHNISKEANRWGSPPYFILLVSGKQVCLVE